MYGCKHKFWTLFHHAAVQVTDPSSARHQNMRKTEMEKKDIPSIDVVEVREEEDSTDEKSDQHKSPIHFVQESVLLFVLRAGGKKNRGRGRERGTKKSKQYSWVKADGVNLVCHCCILLILLYLLLLSA